MMSNADPFQTDSRPENRPISAKRRRERIVLEIRRQGAVSVEKLAADFKVTVQTIRRDLNELSLEGRLTRRRGGGASPSSVANIDYCARQVMNQLEKKAIAALVARHIPDSASIFLNIGTTTEAVAAALIGHKNLRVVTNNLNVASILSRHTDFEIIMTGGSVRRRDGGVLGLASLNMISQFRVDIGVVGISGVDADGALLDYDYQEICAAQTIMRCARKTYLVTDHTKFFRRPLVHMASITDVAAVFTDQKPPDAICEILQGAETQLYVVDANAMEY